MTAPLDPVFASTFMYSACKVVGANVWLATDECVRGSKAWELANLETSYWPAFRTLAELREVCDFEAFVDASTYIDRARCVAAKHFLASGKDVWLTLDDDMFAREGELRTLITACRTTRGGVAIPYMNRDGGSMTFRRVGGPTAWVEGIPLRPVDRVGMGLVALHRDFVEALALHVPFFREKGQPGGARDCPFLFRNDVEDDGTFIGEDFYFSKLADDLGMPLQVLLDAPASHAGMWSKLDSEGRICVTDESVGARLAESIAAKNAAFESNTRNDLGRIDAEPDVKENVS